MDLSSLFDLAKSAYGLLSYKRPSGKIWPPLRFTLEPTHRCNLICPFCYVSARRDRQQAQDLGSRRAGELSTEEWAEVIGRIPRWAFISFEGGEVFVRPDFMEILKLACRRVWGKVNLISNATLLDEAQLDELLRLRPLVFSTSLDAWEGRHDELRGPGAFAKTRTALEYLASRRRGRWPMLDVKTVLLPENLQDLPRLYQLCLDCGADFFSISLRCDHHLKQSSHLFEKLEAVHTSQLHPMGFYFDWQEFLDIWQSLAALENEALRKGKKPPEVRWAPKFTASSGFSAPVLQELRAFLEAGAAGRAVGRIYAPCRYPFANLFIGPYGDIYPCLSISMGNVRSLKRGESLSVLYNGEKYCQFRRALRAQGVFNACQMCCEALVHLRS